MDKKRNTKELELFEKKENNNLQEKRDISKKQEETEKISTVNENNSSKKGDDHSFYSDKEPQNKIKKLWKNNKLFKHGIIWGTVAAIGLSVGLGVGLGIDWTHSSNRIIINPDFSHNPSEEEWEDWLNQRVDSIDVKIDRLVDEAILYRAEELENEGTFNKYSAKWLPQAEKQADNSIRTEKDDYKKNYGSQWKKEWTKKLITEGFDNEEEYRTHKISTSIYGYIENLYIGNDKYINTTNNTGYQFSSSIKSNAGSGSYKVISNSAELNKTNVEEYYELYLRTQIPLATSSIDLSWTFTDSTGIYHGLDGNEIVFADSGSDFINTFHVFRAIYNGNDATEHYNGDWIEEEMNKGINGSIERMGVSGNTTDEASLALKNNIITTLFNGGNDTVTTNVIDGKDFAEQLHLSIGSAVSELSTGVSWPTDINDVKTEDFEIVDGETLRKAGIYFLNGSGAAGNTGVKTELNKGSGGRAISRILEIENISPGSTEYLLTFTTTGLSITKVQGIDSTDFDNVNASLLFDVGKDYTTKDLNKITDSNNSSNDLVPNFGILTDFDTWIQSNLDYLILNDALTDNTFVQANFTNDDPPLNEIVKTLYGDFYTLPFTSMERKTNSYEDYLDENNTVYEAIDPTKFNTLKTTLNDELIYYIYDWTKNNYVPITIEEILANNGDLTIGI